MIDMNKSLFVLAAVFNIGGGLLLLKDSGLVAEISQLTFSISESNTTALAAVIMLFGLLFLWISRAPDHHVPYIRLGILAKVLFAILWVVLVYESLAGFGLLLLGLADLIFARMFYLRIKLNF